MVKILKQKKHKAEDLTERTLIVFFFEFVSTFQFVFLWLLMTT
jgi:hypothetical protein